MLLSGDILWKVRELKASLGRDLLVLGSGALLRSLAPHGLLATFTLLIHPIVLGSGQRLFGAGQPRAAFELVDTKASTSGVIVATYAFGG